jgi:hypothetical protein
MKNKKLKLLGISKFPHRSLYAFPREQKLFEIIREILFKLKFEDGPNREVESFGRPEDDRGEKILNEEENIKNKNYNERIIDFANENYSIDIIFFSKKVVLIFNYKKDRQQEIAKIMDEYILEEE